MLQDVFRRDSIAAGLLLAPIVFLVGIITLYVASWIASAFY